MNVAYLRQYTQAQSGGVLPYPHHAYTRLSDEGPLCAPRTWHKSSVAYRTEAWCEGVLDFSWIPCCAPPRALSVSVQLGPPKGLEIIPFPCFCKTSWGSEAESPLCVRFAHPPYLLGDPSSPPASPDEDTFR